MSLALSIFNHHINSSNNNRCLKFFLKNETRYLIWILSVTRFDNPIIKNFAFYYKNIPPTVSSHININNQIDLALQENFLINKKSDIDKRSMIITATDETVEVFNDYFKKLKKIL